MRAIVTGATGVIGPALLERLQSMQWDRPVALSRDAAKADQNLARFSPVYHSRTPLSGPPPTEAFEGVDVVFHLAGESIVSGRWTKARKQRIRDSRVVGTRNLVEGMARLTARPSVLISASAVGYYGSCGEMTLTESSPHGNDFLADVCVEWEAAARAAEPLGVRVVLSRTGVVLGPAGALAKMLPPFKLGLGGPLGNGRAWMPWIHIDDLVGLWLHAVQTPAIAGPMNAVGRIPATNREFTRALAQQLHRPAFLPVPYFALRILLGEVADVLFASQRAIAEVAEKSGFTFRYPDVAAALGAILQ